MVKLSGYTTGSRVFVADALVGNDPGNTSTGVGLYGHLSVPRFLLSGNERVASHPG